MKPQTKQWQISTPISMEADQALSKYPPEIRQILYNRGIADLDNAISFLQAKLPNTAQSMSLIGIEAAVDRIMGAIHKGERIAVYGDYDVDGVTATALLVQVIQAMHGEVSPYIPNRFDEGYGLNIDALINILEKGVSLVITVDCGIRSVYEALFAKENNLDIIISDHHHPGDELPPAIAIINPKQPNEIYPHRELAGVGLAYKLAITLIKEYSRDHQTKETWLSAPYLLDLVALGTVADLAPLVGENRTLVRQGIEFIRTPRRQGIQSLLGVAQVSPSKVEAETIAFILGPRLNAAGRLESAEAALELMLSPDIRRCGELAQTLDNQNRERQRITKEIQKEAEEMIQGDDPEALLLFVTNPKFNPGVIGLAASRLSDRYYRPTIIASQGEEFTRGSCRSIPEFHITEALDRCADLLEHHGGHAAAAGFTIRTEFLPELSSRLEEIATEQLAGCDLRQVLVADVETTLYDLKPELILDLKNLEPTGYGNPKAAFVSRNLQVMNKRTVGSDRSHLKLVVNDGKVTYDAIAFQMGSWLERVPRYIDLLYTFEVNEFNGKRYLQLNVKDIQESA